MASSEVQIRLLNGSNSILSVDNRKSADDAIVHLAKTWAGFKICPTVVPLFALRTQKGQWLAPNASLKELDKQSLPLELRLRFKVPMPSKLRDLDRTAFLYYFSQTRLDFCSGEVIRLVSNADRSNSRKVSWWFPIISTESDHESDSKRVTMYRHVAHLASLLMTVDILDESKTAKDVVKNIKAYIPKDIYASNTEKIMGSSKFKGLTESLIHPWLLEKASSNMVKVKFLNEMENSFRSYYNEYFTATFDIQSSNRHIPVRLVFCPPFKSLVEPFEEKEPSLGMVEEINGKKFGPEQALCLVEEACNISVRGEEDSIKLELSRKNGIPIYFTMHSRMDCMSFLSLISGYYRLCEKWTFSLCNEIFYSSLQFNLANNVHGPLTNEFVEEKFKFKSKNKPGSFLLRQSCEKYDRYHLHYIPESSTKPEVLTIEKKNSKYHFLGHTFDTLHSLVKELRDPGNKLTVFVKDCLHPSEFDKAPTLLLCRSIEKLRCDLTGGESNNLESDTGVLVQFKQLSRFENERMDGKFTNVWRGMWRRKKQDKQEVAIKQLKVEHQMNKLAHFSHVNYNVLSWKDSTLVGTYGLCLHTNVNPMALIMEYFPLGTLDDYLQNNVLLDVDLMEACTSLARALWYLEENENYNHGKIRCKNVFVSEHTDSSFKVKLGDSGLGDFYAWDEVHWLSLELLILEKPSQVNCTIKGDVWALATTFWQIFSNGATPMPNMNPQVARQQYIRGDRLDRPARLKGYLGQLYEVMQECWNPNAELRKEPQSIMRDTNQLLYRVFNARHIHSYMTVDDDELSSVGSSTLSNQSSGSQDSNKTITTQLGSLVSQPMTQNGTATNYSRLESKALVPTFNDMVRKYVEQGVNNDVNLSDELFSNSDSSEFLLSNSRPGSSLEGSMFQTDMSQFTSQTSLGTLYSMSSIYQLSSEKQLELNHDFPLGEGNFGIVYKGVMSRSNGEWDQVAVKKFKDEGMMGVEAMEEMQRELDIMKGLNHDNVVKIKGILHDNDNVILIMEYLSEGSLDRYLNVHKDVIRFPSQLFTFAHNIIDGMVYLGQKGIIHRDLAARNILVANEEVVKISDFGLARTVDSDHYIMSSNTNIPVKWLALESLTHKLFTYASDVWSFGITLWEMFTFGSSPYLHGCQDFFKAGASDIQHQQDMKLWLQYLDEGKRMPKPDLCPNAIYNDVMLPCWHREPKKRPTFTELALILSQTELQVT